MAQAMLEQRITNLEDLMAQLLNTVDRVGRQLEQTDRQLKELSEHIWVTFDRMDHLLVVRKSSG